MTIFRSYRLRAEVTFKVNKSVYTVKSGQWYDFLLHVPNHVLKDIYMLNYGIINNMNSLYYSSIEVLIDFINSVIAVRVFFNKQPHFFTSASSYLWPHKFSV